MNFEIVVEPTKIIKKFMIIFATLLFINEKLVKDNTITTIKTKNVLENLFIKPSQ